ncbi:Outer membrane receptor proteins, mostly Fe transport [Catalinimonas alkaloidigena]|uniref:Outer membrane receptor proteins, mostly Fe transport n=1 Tax=Catalinimonas alkaloidigena TaxID=1075417 RepID=A0A1G9TKW9_9BACT|nr:outer membrane beta-barrel family protein [Catalinimonas alkaloidigena]SDM48272.1 Outer membrane receptor proteins, mostly Fe transport [Catalinimonas alkaloidigena]
MRDSYFLFLLCFFGGLLPCSVGAQSTSVTVSGQVKDAAAQTGLPYVNVVVVTGPDSAFVTGTVTNDAGRFTLAPLPPASYVLQVSLLGYQTRQVPLYVGSASDFLTVATIELQEQVATLQEVTVTGRQEAISEQLEKKTYTVAQNLSQRGGSVLQAMQNLPGVTVQDGQVLLRGSNQVMVLIDGKQTALTGFNSQTGLDNLPASAIETIEIINNPSARYDANGNAGIINIISKKEQQKGWNGTATLTTGLGALWVRRGNLPTIRPQYQATPKINPSLALNYRTDKVNAFVQGDYLYTQTLNKNEFVTRTYDDGTVIQQQTKRNRNTGFLTTKAGVDWQWRQHHTLTVSGLVSSEKILDRGDEPFFNGDLSERYRLWQFLEDELKTTVMATAANVYRFPEAGHTLSVGLNYTYHRENEKYFFDNILPDYTGHDAFKLLSDEHVADVTLDYVRPLTYGRLETGAKFRRRVIPTDMQFFPGLHSPLDSAAGGWATYKETIPALYGTYVFETPTLEAELGLRMEYVGLRYEVNPDHPTYRSNGYHYIQPFPTVRLAYKFDENNRLSLFYNRRVDRPNEVDIRIFPKYDDAEIIKVGNPALRPQFTNTLEAGYKTNWDGGSLYAALYHRMAQGTITRIASTVGDSRLIYAIFQNAGRSYNTGTEVVLAQDVTPWYSFTLNGNVYRNQINAFTVQNLYPAPNVFSAPLQRLWSGNVKWNHTLRLPNAWGAQVTAVYLAPDLIPQGKIGARFSVDVGVKKSLQQGKGEVFLNATDLFNTLVIRRDIQGAGFSYRSTDYYETQVIRLGYSYKF